MQKDVVYRTANPGAIKEYEDGVRAAGDWYRQVREAAEALGHNDGPHGTTDWDGSTTLYGLVPTSLPPEEVPPGWRYIRTRQRLEPERGKAGASARAWLHENAEPEAARVRQRLEQYGLPTHALMGLTLVRPSIELMDGALWAVVSQPIKCSWERVRLSDYWLAKERSEDE